MEDKISLDCSLKWTILARLGTYSLKGQRGVNWLPANEIVVNFKEACTLLFNSEIYIPRNALALASLPNLKYTECKILKK
jgi:hypothetical protein